MSTTIYYGAPSALQRHWTGLHNPSHRVTLVPTERLRQHLLARLAHPPEIVAEDQWLQDILPQHITPIAEGTWEFLLSRAPEHLFPAPWRFTPGVGKSVGQFIQTARQQGLSHLESHVYDRIPWPELWNWFEERLSDSYVDALRMYEYAVASQKVPVSGDTVLDVWGFCGRPAAFWTLLAQWAGHIDLAIWSLPEGVPQSFLERLATVDVVFLDKPAGAHITYYEAREWWEVSHQWLRRQALGWRDAVLVDVPGQSIRRVWSRYQADAEPPLAVAQRLWQLFLMVAQGKASKATTQHWQAAVSVPVDPEWPQHWWARLQHLSHWADLAELISEALERQALRLPHLKRWARQVEAWDVLGGPPRTGEAALYVTNLGLDVDDPQMPVVALHEAPFVPTNYMVLVGYQTGTLTRQLVKTPFDRDQAINEWDQRNDQKNVNAWILKMILEDEGLNRVVIGEYPEFLEAPSASLTEDFDRIPERADDCAIARWYQEWRESGDYTERTGNVGPELTAFLMPHHLSPSALEDFGRCPLSFFFGRLVQIHAEDDGEAQVLPDQIGRWAHRALQLMAQKRLALGLDQVRAMVRQAMQEESVRGLSSVYEEYLEDRLVADLYEALLRDGWDPGATREVEVKIHWQALWPMQGRIDRVDRLGEHRVRLIDYKTGKLSNPHRPRPHNLQLLLYQKALAESRSVEVDGELYGISQRSEFQHRHITHEDGQYLWPLVEKLLEGMRERLRQGHFYPLPDPSVDACRMCQYQRLCPSQVGSYARDKRASDPEYHALWAKEEESHDAH